MAENQGSETTNSPLADRRADEEWSSSGTYQSGEAPDSGYQLNFNQQINFFGEIQGFDNLDKLSPEVRAAALDYLREEQKERHAYVMNEQSHRHRMDERFQSDSSKIQWRAMVTAATVFVVSLVICAALLHAGHGAAGIGIIVAELTTAVGLIIYGKRRKVPREAPGEAENSGNPSAPADDA